MDEEITPSRNPFIDVERAATKWLVDRGLYLDDETYERMRFKIVAIRRRQKQEDRFDDCVDDVAND